MVTKMEAINMFNQMSKLFLEMQQQQEEERLKQEEERLKQEEERLKQEEERLKQEEDRQHLQEQLQQMFQLLIHEAEKLDAAQKHVDENESAAFKQVKIIGGLTTTEVTERAALIDLQNHEVVRTIAAKDAAQKDLKDTTLQNALRGTKASIDTQWENNTTTTTTTNPNVDVTSGEVQKTTKTTETNDVASAGQHKILTRSNSVRLSTSSAATTGLGLQSHVSSHLLVGQNQLIENKVQQVKVKAVYRSDELAKDEDVHLIYYPGAGFDKSGQQRNAKLWSSVPGFFCHKNRKRKIQI